MTPRRIPSGVAVRVWPALLVGLMIAAPSAAQLSAGFSSASFQFNLSNPGARSLGLGGAFTGRADDATAAYANPAGLTILLRPEVSFEGRSARFRLPLAAAEPVVNGGFAVGLGEESLALAGRAELTPLGPPDASESTASFVSVVIPRRTWTFALYRHQLARLQAEDAAPLRPIQTVLFEGGFFEERFATSGQTRARALIDVSSLGFAAARKIGPRLSAGITLVRNEASLEASRTSAFTVERTGFPAVRPRFDDLVRGDDTDLTLNVGLLLRPNRRWSLGMSFREGPTFGIRQTSSSAGFEEFETAEVTEPFRVPDVLSVGLSSQITRRLVVAAEWDRVRYSVLRRISSVPASLDFGPGSAPDLASLGSFTVDDADELRAGLELTFWRVTAVPSLRLGVWHDPDHQIRFSASPACPGAARRQADSYSCTIEATQPAGLLSEVAALQEEVLAATAAQALELLFPRGRDRTHLTGGFGLVLGSRVQVDAAVDYVASDQYTLSVSGIFQF